MRQNLSLIGFAIVAIALFALWGNLSSRIVAVESDTGSYLYAGNDNSADIIALTGKTDLSALQRQLAKLQARQLENAAAIEALSQRVDQLETQGCSGSSCGRLGLRRETVHFDHDTSELSPSEKGQHRQAVASHWRQRESPPGRSLKNSQTAGVLNDCQYVCVGELISSARTTTCKPLLWGR